MIISKLKLILWCSLLLVAEGKPPGQCKLVSECSSCGGDEECITYMKCTKSGNCQQPSLYCCKKLQPPTTKV